MEKTFCVSPHPMEGWLGKEYEDEHYLVISQNKQEVLDHLMKLGESSRPCTIVIQNEKGEYLEEHTLAALKHQTK